MKDNWLTKAAIKERGWTEGAIKKFLGAPEKTKTNPHYRTGPPMLLWCAETIYKAEQNPQFIEWKNKHNPRRNELRERAIEQHQQKRSLLVEWVNSLEIEVPKYSKKKLFRFAIANYNDLWSSRGRYEKLIYQDYRELDSNFLHRISVNALLHALSDYEYHLSQVSGLTGAAEARAKLRGRMLASINRTYPDVTYPELLGWLDEIVSEDEKNFTNQTSTIIAAITNLSKKLARIIASNPRGLEDIEWRDLERLLEVVFDGLGFKVALTPASKDGGKDLILECKVQDDKQSYIVEAKHWRSGQRVGRRYISDFINVIVSEKRTGGLYLATYGYSGNVFEALTEVDRQVIKLGTSKKIVSLCRTFVKAEEGVWSAPSALPDLLFKDVA